MLFIKKIVKKITLNVIFLKLKNHQNLNLGLIISKYSNKSNISLENNASIKYFYASGINYLYGHFEGGGGKGCFMPWNKNRKHQKLIYSTKLGLNKIKIHFLAKRRIENKRFLWPPDNHKK
jgi:hypothetical protein